MDASTIATLDTRRRAALIAGTLKRLVGVISELQAARQDLRMPTDRIVTAYTDLAMGLAPGPLAWEFDVAQVQGSSPNVRALVESSADAFTLAVQPVAMLDPGRCWLVLQDTQEVAEVLSNWNTSTVEVERATDALLADEVSVQTFQLERLRHASDAALPQALSDVLDESERVGERYVAHLRLLMAASIKAPSPDPSSTRGRIAEVIGALGALARGDWQRVERCATEKDYESIKPALQSIVRAIGISAAHDIIGQAGRALGLPEKGGAWEAAYWVLLATAAWDQLDAETKRLLTECVSWNDGVRHTLQSWI
jgi:hypothetical protein